MFKILKRMEIVSDNKTYINILTNNYVKGKIILVSLKIIIRVQVQLNYIFK